MTIEISCFFLQACSALSNGFQSPATTAAPSGPPLPTALLMVVLEVLPSLSESYSSSLSSVAHPSYSGHTTIIFCALGVGPRISRAIFFPLSTAAFFEEYQFLLLKGILSKLFLMDCYSCELVQQNRPNQHIKMRARSIY